MLIAERSDRGCGLDRIEMRPRPNSVQLKLPKTTTVVIEIRACGLDTPRVFTLVTGQKNV
jgi:hypothetical protein